MGPDLHLIVLAGGSGSRARAGTDAPPKQFVQAGGRTLLGWCLSRLLAAPRVASLTVTCPDDQRERLDAVLLAAAPPCAPRVARAGETRTASTWNALDLLAREAAPADDDLVAVHDAARPFASADLLARLAAAAMEHGGAVPGVPVADTVVQVRPDTDDVDYLERIALRAVQTPQVFRWAPFVAAHRDARDRGVAFTDDGGLMAAAGSPPALVAGEVGNWKVTDAADLARARDLLGGDA